LVVLLALLGLVALNSARPWEDESVGPSLSLAPGLGAAPGGAGGVGQSAGPALADARPAAGDRPAPASTGAAADGAAAAPRVAVSRARPVAHLSPSLATVPQPQPQPAPAELAPAAPAPAPVAVPVAAPSPQPQPEPAVAEPDAGKPSGGGGSPGPGTAGVDLSFPFAAFKVEEGEAYLLSASFQLGPAAFRPPGGDNLLVQFNSAGGDAPSFGLQLWDDGLGRRGLWSSGAAMGGERFLAPLAESHLVEVYFQASSEGTGFYLAFLDGEAIDARAGVSLIDPGSERATVEVGLFRDGEFVPAGPEVVFAAASLAEASGPLLP